MNKQEFKTFKKDMLTILKADLKNSTELVRHLLSVIAKLVKNNGSPNETPIKRNKVKKSVKKVAKLKESPAKKTRRRSKKA